MGFKRRSEASRFSFERLPEVMAAAMLGEASEKERENFIALAASADKERKASAASRAGRDRVYGWAASEDTIHWDAAGKAYAKYFHQISDVWMLGGTTWKKFSAKPKDTFGGFEGGMVLLCGLEHFGDDPCGDTAWISTLPSPWDTTEVFLYDHEVGKIDGHLGYGFADFVVDRFADEDEMVEGLAQESSAFAAEARKMEKTRNPLWNAKVLFDRSEWLIPLGAGSTAYGFAKSLGQAPTMKDWQKEKSLFAEAPWLANYWLLAHFFLGNDKACAEAVGLAASVQAEATRELAREIEKVLGGKAKTFARLKAAQIAEIREACAKNATPELLEKEEESAAGTLDKKECRQRLKEGQDPWSLIEEFPTDTTTHDLALEAAAKTDKSLASVLKSYLRERSDDAYNQWPWDEEDLDRRLSLPVSAAFRSGLRYDDDHDRAHAGITRTLAMFDDDNAMDAFEEAVAKLPVSDDRLEYVVQGLTKSKHPRAAGIFSRAAWRTFDAIDEARKNQDRLDDKRKKEGITLDNMFPTRNHLLLAVEGLLSQGGPEAVKLADRLLQEKDTGRILGRRVGEAIRVAGDAGLEDHKKFILWYIEAVSKIVPDDPRQGVNAMNLDNFAEACIAAAKLWPDELRPKIKEFYERETDNANLNLDIKSGTLGARLLLEGVNEDHLYWIERILGNRTTAPRIVPTLRAVAEAKLTQARGWTYHHVYSKKNDLIDHEPVITVKAIEAMTSLGEADLPDFDEDSKFGSGLKTAQEVREGFEHPEKFWPSYLCKRAREKDFVDDSLCDTIATWTREQLRFSADNPGHGDIDDAEEGLKALGKQGERGQDALASMLEIEHLDDNTRAYLLLAIRLSANEASRWKDASEIPMDTVLSQLSAPSDPKWIGYLDLLAARALVSDRSVARAPIEHALHWRYERSGCHHDNLGIDLKRLPMLLASLGPETTATLKALKKATEDNHYVDDFIKDAIKASTKEKKPSALAANTSSIKLKQQRESGNGWVAHLSLERGKSLATDMKDVYLNLVDTDKMAYKTSLPSAESFESLAQMAELMGYR